MENLSAHAVGRPLRVHVDAAATLRCAIGRALTTLRTWHQRACIRRQLLALNDHLLADIGMSRDEAAKPFWQA